MLKLNFKSKAHFVTTHEFVIRNRKIIELLHDLKTYISSAIQRRRSFRHDHSQFHRTEHEKVS